MCSDPLSPRPVTTSAWPLLSRLLTVTLSTTSTDLLFPRFVTGRYSVGVRRHLDSKGSGCPPRGPSARLPHFLLLLVSLLLPRSHLFLVAELR